MVAKKEKCAQCGKSYKRLAQHVAIVHDGKKIGGGSPKKATADDWAEVSSLRGELGRIMDLDDRSSTFHRDLYIKGRPNPVHEEISLKREGSGKGFRNPIWRRII